METRPKKIMIVAGEASGDLHGSHLVKELLKINPELQFSGLGGPLMRKSGVDVFTDLTKIAVVGFFEVLKHYPTFKQIFNDFLHRVDHSKPDAVILIDYPGFNLRLAKELKQRDVKVLYYISPQVWAWKEQRVEQIRNYVDRMFVIFNFEKEFYKKHNIDVDFVGHPLLDTIPENFDKKNFCQNHQLRTDQPLLALLPGSRPKEIERMLPLMLCTTQLIKKELPDLQVVLLKSKNLAHLKVDIQLRAFPDVKLIEQETYAGIHAADVCIVTSGTATLETGILHTPMVICYKTSFLTWLLAKMFVKIKDIGLINVVAKQRIVPEFVQYKATPPAMAKETLALLKNSVRRDIVISDLKGACGQLGTKGALAQTASIMATYF